MVPPVSGVAKAEDLHTITLPRRATAREKERMVAIGGVEACLVALLTALSLFFFCRSQRVLYRNNAFLSGVDVFQPRRMLRVLAAQLNAMPGV